MDVIWPVESATTKSFQHKLRTSGSNVRNAQMPMLKIIRDKEKKAETNGRHHKQHSPALPPGKSAAPPASQKGPRGHPLDFA